MSVSEVRESFLKFFEGKGCTREKSSSLVPLNDPTLMFTSAGMVQFKPYFMGLEEPPARRLTSIQRCFRTTDVEVVGDDNHLTLFEMLGNWSFGDYYKREAIGYAWELLTKVWGIDKTRLHATVYETDDEAFELLGHRHDLVEREPAPVPRAAARCAAHRPVEGRPLADVDRLHRPADTGSYRSRS
mgnify:CR=1 FL=1